MNIDRCGSCGAEIIWAVSTKSGKPTPIDAHPVDIGGNVSLNETGGAKVLARTLTKAQGRAWTGPLHISHFATCPDSNLHRRR